MKSKKESFNVMGNIILKMVTFTKDNSNKINFMAMESTYNRMESNIIKDSLKITKKMVMGSIIMSMARFIKVNGKTISNMVKASIKMQKMTFMKVKLIIFISKG